MAKSRRVSNFLIKAISRATEEFRLMDKERECMRVNINEGERWETQELIVLLARQFDRN